MEPRERMALSNIEYFPARIELISTSAGPRTRKADSRRRIPPAIETGHFLTEPGH
jgi:hypothetical protein